MQIGRRVSSSFSRLRHCRVLRWSVAAVHTINERRAPPHAAWNCPTAVVRSVGARCQTGICVRAIGALFGVSRDRKRSRTQSSGGAEAMAPWDDMVHCDTHPIDRSRSLLDLKEAAGGRAVRWNWAHMGGGHAYVSHTATWGSGECAGGARKQAESTGGGLRMVDDFLGCLT